MSRCTNVYVHPSTTIMRVRQHFVPPNDCSRHATFCITWRVDIFTARKRSLGQGNIFTGICLSTGGGGLPDRETPWIETPWTETPLNKDPPWTETTPLDRDHPWTWSPLYGKKWMVRILLECILVFSWVFIRGSRCENELKSVQWPKAMLSKLVTFLYKP